MILAASRKKAVCFSLKVDAAAIYEAIQELFDDLGGVTLELLIDNPKALVIENHPKKRGRNPLQPTGADDGQASWDGTERVPLLLAP